MKSNNMLKIQYTVLKEKMKIEKYLGREALLIGSLAAFITQALMGLFIMNRSINGAALLTFMFPGTFIVSHILVLKK